ncbi:hypothetical protein [Gillisia xinjiangensis]|uniref:hypothetical protein n=1 Tax=Gillisia xinjiangensis TaxID=3384765 RepID=UPI0039187DC2
MRSTFFAAQTILTSRCGLDRHLQQEELREGDCIVESISYLMKNKGSFYFPVAGLIDTVVLTRQLIQPW